MSSFYNDDEHESLKLDISGLDEEAHEEKPKKLRAKTLQQQAQLLGKPVYNRKTSKWVYPTPASGMPASGKPASGIPKNEHKPLNIQKKYFGLNNPPTEEWEQNQLGVELLEWAQTDEARNIHDFATARHINPYKLNKLCARNEYFEDCMAIARSLIGSRMTELARTREEDGSVNMKLLPLYNHEYRDMIEQAKKLAEGAPATSFVIHGMAVESSSLVPELPKKQSD